MNYRDATMSHIGENATPFGHLRFRLAFFRVAFFRLAFLAVAFFRFAFRFCGSGAGAGGPGH